jgi:hypothetical protein
MGCDHRRIAEQASRGARKTRRRRVCLRVHPVGIPARVLRRVPAKAHAGAEDAADAVPVIVLYGRLWTYLAAVSAPRRAVDACCAGERG